MAEVERPVSAAAQLGPEERARRLVEALLRVEAAETGPLAARPSADAESAEDRLGVGAGVGVG
ncbi:hypothetical protein ACGF4C_07490 [Streptomyces sp. NPDC048197]|uniref:hypothetical protein n=1 Tax=Streptomyces sp. NPDC048197 TaxID=3365511 RepID=UPI00371F37DB